MNSYDVMVDLETCGVFPGCVVLTIGATDFREERQFYNRIAVDSSLAHGLVQEPGTMSWWARQDFPARQEAFSGDDALTAVLGEFADWLKGYGKETFVWGNGADFDLPILAAAYKAVGMENPWKPFNVRCYRTLKNLYKNIPMDKFQGVKHKALDDAIMQARHAHQILTAHFR